LYLRAMPATARDQACPILARDYADEVIESWGGPPRTRLVHKSVAPGRVDFELKRLDPKPQGEVILSRVVCGGGVLAVVSCAGPTPVEPQLRPLCEEVLDSVSVGPGARRPGA
jgi:hypothetical protein